MDPRQRKAGAARKVQVRDNGERSVFGYFFLSAVLHTAVLSFVLAIQVFGYDAGGLPGVYMVTLSPSGQTDAGETFNDTSDNSPAPGHNQALTVRSPAEETEGKAEDALTGVMPDAKDATQEGEVENISAPISEQQPVSPVPSSVSVVTQVSSPSSVTSVEKEISISAIPELPENKVSKPEVRRQKYSAKKSVASEERPAASEDTRQVPPPSPAVDEVTKLPEPVPEPVVVAAAEKELTPETGKKIDTAISRKAEEQRGLDQETESPVSSIKEMKTESRSIPDNPTAAQGKKIMEKASGPPSDDLNTKGQETAVLKPSVSSPSTLTSTSGSAPKGKGIAKRKGQKTLQQFPGHPKGNSGEAKHVMADKTEGKSVLPGEADRGSSPAGGLPDGSGRGAGLSNSSFPDALRSLSGQAGKDERPGPNAQQVARINSDEDKQKEAAPEKTLTMIRVPDEFLTRDIKVLIDVGKADIHSVMAVLSKRPHPSASGKGSPKEAKRVEESEETTGDEIAGYAGIKKIISVRKAEKGVYIFSIENKGHDAITADIAFRLFEKASGGRTKEYKAIQLQPFTSVRFKFLVPDLLFWDDTDRFSGSIEDSDTETKFEYKTGVVWKEAKE